MGGAVYRAAESERPDALFHDPYARGLAGERGQAIVDALPFGQSMGWSMVVRTAVLDELILRCVKQGARTVVNLGAGLDTRAFRLDLPPTLRWLDVDLPDVVAYRRAHLATAVARCRHLHVEADLRLADERRRVFSEAGREGPVVVVTEGLLIYLADEQVAELATQLHGGVGGALVAGRPDHPGAAADHGPGLAHPTGGGRRCLPLCAR